MGLPTSSYQLWRDYHFLLPGGTLRIPGTRPVVSPPRDTIATDDQRPVDKEATKIDRCLCLAQDLTDDMIVGKDIADDGVVWAVFRRCPIHGEQHKSPLWHPEFGYLRQSKTATEQVAVERGA